MFLKLTSLALQMSDPNRDLLTAVNQNKLEAVRALLKNPAVDVNMHASLHWAVTFGKVEMSKLLIDSGADVNKHAMAGKDTPLIIALSHSHPELAQYLLEHGANPNIASRGSHSYPLSHAHALPMVDLLLKHGAKVNFPGEQTSFLSAALHRPDILKRLLQVGAEVNTTGSDGYTPLITAVEQGLDDAVKILLQHGANMEVLGPSGRSVYEIATKPSTRKLLETFHPAPIPITKISAADQIVEPAKIIHSSAPASPVAEAPLPKRKTWLGKMFGSKGNSNPVPSAPEKEGAPVEEGLFARHRRMKQSGMSVEEWLKEEAKRGAAVDVDEDSTHTTYHTTLNSPSPTSPRSTGPTTTTAYVTPTTVISSDIFTADTTTTITPTTATLAVNLTDRECMEQMEVRIARLERVVEDQAALIAKLLKIVDVKSSPMSEV